MGAQRYYRRRRAETELVRRFLGCKPQNQVPLRLRPTGPGARYQDKPPARHRDDYPGTIRTRPYKAGELRPLPDAVRAARAARPPLPPRPAAELRVGLSGLPWRRASAGTRPTVLAYGNARFAVSRPGTTASPARRARAIAEASDRCVVLPVAEANTSTVCSRQCSNQSDPGPHAASASGRSSRSNDATAATSVARRQFEDVRRSVAIRTRVQGGGPSRLPLQSGRVDRCSAPAAISAFSAVPPRPNAQRQRQSWRSP